MNVCTVRLRNGEQETFRNAKGEEDGFNVIVYEDVDVDQEPSVIARFGLSDVRSWWNREEEPPAQAEGHDPDPDPFA